MNGFSNVQPLSAEEWYNQGKTLYINGNFKESIQCYLKAAEDQHVESLRELGYAYKIGKGVEANYTKSIEWYYIADKNSGYAGNNSARLCIAEMFREGGPGLDQDFKQALTWYKKVIDNIHDTNSNNYAYSRMGELFETGGPGIERSHSSAKFWYEKCRSSDYPWMIIASFYRDGGYGIEKNYVKAIVWYSQVKEGKYIYEASFNMGFMYQHGGYGITKDYKEALICYERAISNNLFDSRIHIGQIYEVGGYGVPKNGEAALKWYQSALKNGNENAREYIESYNNTLLPIVLPTTEELKEEQQKLQKAYKKILSLKAELELNDAGVRDFLDRGNTFTRNT
ncbi:hypothetical protein EDC94DRAFT_595811 [Helicostylum pulchrum]|nr:hypothetical protein EDC94DRAFT_595811 [Helicostylum pulchrum]